MKLPEMPFTTVDWSSLATDEHPGTTSTSFWRTYECNELRARLVSYEPGFEADHWCDRGHVLYVLSGELGIRLRDGRNLMLKKGSGFCVSDNGDVAHLVYTENGCRVFIVD